MTHAEATALISTLALAFPRERFTLENAAVYERAIADLDAQDGQAAVETLICDAVRMPTVAELRAAAAKAKIARTGADRPLPVPALSRGEFMERAEWKATLARMLESQARYQRGAEAWYAERGKKAPPYPGEKYVRMAMAGAEGKPMPFDVKGFRL